MKTKEILEKHKDWIGGLSDTAALKAMSEVEQQTRDEIFEFVEWVKVIVKQVLKMMK